MAYLDFDPSLDFDAQEQEMLQAAARIKALRSANLKGDIEQPQGFTSAVTGARVNAPTVKRPLLSSLTPLIQDFTAGRQEKELNQQRARVSTAQQDALRQWMAGTPTPVAATEDVYGAGEEGPTMTPGTPGQPVTRAQVLAHAAQGMRNPLSRTLAGQYLGDQLIKEPEREEARAERKMAKEQAIAEAQRKQAEDLAYRRERDAAAAQLRREMQEQSIQARREIAAAVRAGRASPSASWKDSGTVDDEGRKIFFNERNPQETFVGTGSAGTTKPTKPLPVALSGKWIGNNTSLTKVNETLKMLETQEGKESIGLKGYLPDPLLKYGDPEGTAMRAALADIGTLEVHSRSGAAVTAAEYPRLQPFIPTASDTPEVAAKKLKRFKREYESLQQEILDYAEDMGYKAPTVRNRESNEPATPEPAAPAPVAPGVAPAPAPVRRRKWNPATGKLE